MVNRFYINDLVGLDIECRYLSYDEVASYTIKEYQIPILFVDNINCIFKRCFNETTVYDVLFQSGESIYITEESFDRIMNWFK